MYTYPNFILVYIYAIVCICKYIGMCTLGKGSLFLSRSLSLSSQTSHTHTQIRCRSKYHALLHAHTLTDDGMHLVLQTGSTAYM
jgi:hypothetical protein